MPQSEADAKPTPELVRELYEWIQRHWQEQFTVDTDQRELAETTHAVVVPDTASQERKRKVEPVRMVTGEGYRIVDLIWSLVAHPADIDFAWTGGGVKSEGQSDAMKRSYDEARDQLNPPGDSPLLRGRGHMVSVGREATLWLPGDKYWWDTPKKQAGETNVAWAKRYDDWKRKAPLPVVWKDLPPESTFPSTLSRSDDEALSWSLTTYYELMDIFSTEELTGIMPDERERWYEQCILATYSNRSWVGYFVLATQQQGVPGTQLVGGRGVYWDDKMIRVVEHNLGKCAIRIMPGVTGPWMEPGRYWRGVLFGVRGLIRQADERFSEAATASRFNVLPKLKTWLHQRDDEDATARTKRILAGDIFDLDPGDAATGEGREDVQPIWEPSTISDTMGLAQFLLARTAQISGAMEALEGNFGPGDMPAWRHNFATQVAISRFSRLSAAVTAADADHADMFLRCVEAFGEELTLQEHKGDKAAALKIVPGELLNWAPTITSEYRPAIPQDTRTNFSLGLDAMVTVIDKRLPVSVPLIMERLMDIDNVTEEFKRATTWRFLLSQPLEDWMLQNALKEADARLSQQEGVTPEQFAQDFAGRIPPQMQQFVEGKIAQRRGNGGGPGLSNEAQAQLQAERAPRREQPPRLPTEVQA